MRLQTACRRVFVNPVEVGLAARFEIALDERTCLGTVVAFCLGWQRDERERGGGEAARIIFCVMFCLLSISA